MSESPQDNAEYLSVYAKLMDLETPAEELRDIYLNENESFIVSNLVNHPNTPLDVIQELLERYGNPKKVSDTDQYQYDSNITGDILKRNNIPSEILEKSFEDHIHIYAFYIVSIIIRNPAASLTLLRKVSEMDTVLLVDSEHDLIISHPNASDVFLLDLLENEKFQSNRMKIAERLHKDFTPYKGLPLEWVVATLIGE